MESLRAAGLAASAAELRRELGDAPPPYVEGAIANPRLDHDHVLQMLANRRTPADVLLRISRHPEWRRTHDIRKRVVFHPNTPGAISGTLVHHLYWRELAAVATDLRLHPVLRRRAVELLRVRMEELTLGERISLARRATQGLIEPLRTLGEPQVLQALLGNPRLIERDVVRMAESRDVPGVVLDEIAAHPRWQGRPAVRRGLVRNPRTPVHTALRVLASFPVRELHRIGSDSGVPRVVRLRCARLLREASERRTET